MRWLVTIIFFLVQYYSEVNEVLSNLQPVDVPQPISIQFNQLFKDLQIYDQWSHASNVYLFI